MAVQVQESLRHAKGYPAVSRQPLHVGVPCSRRAFQPTSFFGGWAALCYRKPLGQNSQRSLVAKPLACIARSFYESDTQKEVGSFLMRCAFRGDVWWSSKLRSASMAYASWAWSGATHQPYGANFLHALRGKPPKSSCMLRQRSVDCADHVDMTKRLKGLGAVHQASRGKLRFRGSLPVWQPSRRRFAAPVDWGRGDPIYRRSYARCMPKVWR